MGNQLSQKFILVHLGPHKTGTTALQKNLTHASERLRDADTLFLHTPETHAAALDLAEERFERAEEQLSGIAKVLSSRTESTIILSHEDFCGSFIGRSSKRKIYPKLTKNLRILARALRPHHVKFVFFTRPEADWLKSSYHQHLKYRTRFHSLDDFVDFYGEDFSWRAKLAKPSEAFGQDLVIIPYQKTPSFGTDALLQLIPSGVFADHGIPATQTLNPAPSAVQIQHLERINEMSEFRSTAGFSKSLLLRNQTPHAAEKPIDFPAWPPEHKEPPATALPKLLERSKTRVATQNIEDILPSPTVNLEVLLHDRLPADVEMPRVQRANIQNQSMILNYHLRGKSKLNHLNALVISYLRRDTKHTQKARLLFHRIWREQGVALVNELSTRWLLSTLQTFLDHGETEAQRAIGTAGYFYGNMIKIYEGERSIEGHAPDASYDAHEPQTPNKFRGLDRYQVGGTDLMLNTNALALEIAQREPVAGLVLQEFLLRVKNAETVFSRHDRTRKKMDINQTEFQDVWAFFEPWDE